MIKSLHSNLVQLKERASRVRKDYYLRLHSNLVQLKV